MANPGGTPPSPPAPRTQECPRFAARGHSHSPVTSLGKTVPRRAPQERAYLAPVTSKVERLSVGNLEELDRTGPHGTAAQPCGLSHAPPSAPDRPCTTMQPAQTVDPSTRWGAGGRSAPSRSGALAERRPRRARDRGQRRGPPQPHGTRPRAHRLPGSAVAVGFVPENVTGHNRSVPTRPTPDKRATEGSTSNPPAITTHFSVRPTSRHGPSALSIATCVWPYG